ncbi:c-type cytochrome [Sphingomonas bacterium]|uniref:c-type cytochrome n=1 Tax=Sphingomonas bacterium TaxID=1895847 RepID=UPI0015751AC4|nr:cytochrome c [Sphingomonas bacterium]
MSKLKGKPVKTKFSRVLLLATIAACASGEASAQQRPTKTGKQVFETVCQACHLPGGVGDAGTYPALAKNPKLQNAQYPAYVVVNGLKAMPALGALLNDAEIAGVVTYIRTNFGNKYNKPVTPEDIKALRKPVK